MTSQQNADLMLVQWQALRALPPEQRIDALMAEFFAPPSETDLEYEITMRKVATEMAHA